MRYILSKVSKHLFPFLFTLAILFGEAASDLLLPIIMAKMVDDAVFNNDIPLIKHYALVMLVIAFFGAVCALLRNFMSAKYSELVAHEIRTESFVKIESFSFSSFDKIPPADLVTRITNDVSNIQEFVFSLMRIMVKSPVVAVGSIILIFLTVPQLAPIVVPVAIFALLFISLNAYIAFPKYSAVQKETDRINGKIREVINAVRIVKAFSAEDSESIEFSKKSEKLMDGNIGAQRVTAVFMPLAHLAVNMGIVFILYISNTRIKSIGSVMAACNYMVQLGSSVGQISNIINRSVRAAASSARIMEILEEESETDEGRRTEQGPGSIEFRNVSFAYHGENAVEDVSFSVPAFSSLSIIGPTGSGKTTLASLAMGFYRPDSGSILVDGTDIEDWSRDALRNEITIVPQKATLFSGSVIENLKLSDENASPDDIAWALDYAEASFVNKLPEGLDTDLSERGVNLSGGQKQRISIARSLLRRPKILILDDSQSALDAITSEKLSENLFSLGITLIVITQRISVATECDRILVLEDGRVAGIGKSEELLRSSKAYADIYNSQTGVL